jgi:hypothetical protein
MALEVELRILQVTLVDLVEIGNIRLRLRRYLDSRAFLISTSVFVLLPSKNTVFLCHYYGTMVVRKSCDNVVVRPQRNTQR